VKTAASNISKKECSSAKGGDVTATQTICEFLLNTNYRDIPVKVIETAKERFLDTVGVIIAGAVDPDGAGRIAVELTSELGGRPRSTVIAGGFKTSAPNAALANGTSAASLEYDDASTHTVCHYSGALVPAVLAVAEEAKASGKQVLEAFVLAWEIGTRIGACLGGVYFFERGFHPVGTWPCLGTAAATAKLLNCTVEQARTALGIASSMAGSIRRGYGTNTKPLHSGSAARNGIISSMLAKKGFTAHKDILDPEPSGNSKISWFFSFPIAFSGLGNFDLNKVTNGLGESYNLVSQPVTTHFYPGATGTAVFIELAIAMMKAHSFTAADVENVQVKATGDWINGHSPFLDPQTGDQARFSGNYEIAVALVDGKVGIDQYRMSRIHSADVRDMMKRVSISELEGSEDVTRRIYETGDVTKSGLGELKILLKDGREFTGKGEQPRGSGELPLRRADLVEKFRDCANRGLPSDNVERSIEQIWNLEKLRSIAGLMELLRGRR
jgi:2-methylcitrate dehydratase PrpD